MNIAKVDLSNFRTNHDFYPEITLLVTIKSFDLQAIRARYLKTRNKKSHRTGSSMRRKVTIGGVAKIVIKNGVITDSEILTELPEPRGIDFYNATMALSSENLVYIITDKINTIKDPWFSYIHTVNLNRNDLSSVLISSSGFDAIFEYNIQSWSKNFEWFAWENGFDQGLDPDTGENLYLTRRAEKAEYYKKHGCKYIYIDNPGQQTLPTAKRAAFINSVIYDTKKQDSIIATFFHEGAVYNIHRKSGHANKILDGLNSPHGGFSYDHRTMATNTKGGEVVIGDLKNQTRFDFNNLPGKPDYLSDFEWIQNSIPFGDNIIAIDSNRNSFVIFNPEYQLIDYIAFDNNWAVQDLINAEPLEEQLNLVRTIK